MPASPYIPPRDADFDAWLQNFTTLLTAAPATYGLLPADAVVCQAAYDAWHPAYVLATDPATRTSPTVAAKDAERASAEATVRPYAQRISRNASVTNEDKVAIGVNLPNNSPVPIPPPVTQPILGLRSQAPLLAELTYRDSALGDTKKKPAGTIGVQIWTNVGTVPATDPAQCAFVTQATKSPTILRFVAEQRGKQCTVFARWVNRSGAGGEASVGPWSNPLNFFIS